ncbi:MAG: flagellar export protein FliJ [Candidatus Marinimicrobia bacterium]|nr:flagellar export protein FliJ [Candidatus Neomarinimicrobiota bacterium]
MAKSFHFPLQKVLDVRQITEDRQAISLKNSQMSLNKEKEQLENLAQKKDAQLKVDEDEYDNVDDVNLSLNELQVTVDYISQLNNRITNQIQVVEKSNGKVEKERDDLIEASKEKKIVEKLRERQLTNYKDNYRKKMMKEESEIALRVILKNKDNGNNQ